MSSGGDLTSDFNKILARYGGRVLQTESLCAYDRWALEYFRTPQIIDPHVDITVQLDIADIAKSYESRAADAPGSSLTAYLIWGMLKALGMHPSFSWRSIEGVWYKFSDLPLYFPVATGKQDVMQDVLIENACKMSWSEFVKQYRGRIEWARSSMEFQPIGDEVFWLAWFIGNMPQLEFTSFKAFVHKGRCGAPVFYFGKRRESAGRLQVPFYASIDHANAEPGRIEALLADFQVALTRG